MIIARRKNRDNVVRPRPRGKKRRMRKSFFFRRTYQLMRNREPRLVPVTSLLFANRIRSRGCVLLKERVHRNLVADPVSWWRCDDFEECQCHGSKIQLVMPRDLWIFFLLLISFCPCAVKPVIGWHSTGPRLLFYFLIDRKSVFKTKQNEWVKEKTRKWLIKSSTSLERGTWLKYFSDALFFLDIRFWPVLGFLLAVSSLLVAHLNVIISFSLVSLDEWYTTLSSRPDAT